MEYIPINSIDDIDLARISLRDINKRYIDRQGNRFVTRFNLKSRKVELVRIVKGKAEAVRVRQQILRERVEGRPQGKTRSDEPVIDIYSEGEVPDDDFEYTEGIDSRPEEHHAPAAHAQATPFIENQLIEELSHELDRIRERSQGIINNLKKSRYFDSHHESEFSDILREIDISCWQKPEEAVNFYKELYSYPRSVGYYASRLSGPRREKVEKAETEEIKLELIRRWETQETFDATYTGVISASVRLYGLLKNITESDLKMLPASQSQAFHDARSAAEYMIQNSREMQSKISLWKKKFP